jgi:hypothetical protein
VTPLPRRKHHHSAGTLPAAAETCPHATDTGVVGKIIHLRQNCHFRPTKVSMYLKRYHDVAVSSSGA